ncbi:MAG: Do family serine endopeptidase [Campylobacteraceae bacterium]
MKKIFLAISLSAILLNANTIDIIQAPEASERISPTAENVILSYQSSVKDAKKSVVNIATTSTKTVSGNNQLEQMFNDPFFKEFFGGNNPFGNAEPRTRKSSSLGSGVIISQDGYIVTNAHVVEGADEIVVTLLDNNKEYKAKIIGLDSKTDLAVIKIEEKNLNAIKFGNSDKLQEGDVVFAIGNPFGVGGTITQGIISALNKNSVGLNQYENFIQTDASINPGNSGGALIDSRGVLIGINSAILSRSGDNNGIGFAIPANMVKEITTKLVSDGKIERGYLGVSITDLSSEMKELYKNQAGALVMGVEDDKAAAKAGLQRGDLVIKINGNAIKDANELKNLIGKMKPNEKISVTYERGKKEKTISVTLDKMDGDTVVASSTQKSDLIDGLTLENITDGTKYRLPKNTKGILVTNVKEKSAGEEAGFRTGDIILQVGEDLVSNTDELKTALKKAGKDKKAVYISRAGRVSVLVVP